MRSHTLLSCLLVVSLAAGTSPATAVAGAAPGSTLSHAECDRVIRRSLYNLDMKSGSPMKDKLMASCVAGQDHYTRNYYNCVFATKYSDPMDCAYAERGIDRSKAAPELAVRQPGDYGAFQQSVSDMVAAVYKGSDPHTSIDTIDRDRYLDQRDSVLRSLDETPPADRHLPSHTSTTKLVAGEATYWVVREDFQDLQLVKVVNDDKTGSSTVMCARYGSADRIDIAKGYCGALVSKYLHVKLTQ